MPINLIQFPGNVVINSGHAIYWGDPNTNGSWRQIHVPDDLETQRREAGAWNEKNTDLATDDFLD